MKPQLNFILLNGAMGSGKSTIAGILGKKLERTAILEIEDIRKLVTGDEDNPLAWKIIYRMCDEYLKNGVNVLLKQSVASQDLVNKFLRLAKKHKYTIGFYHLQAPSKVLKDRVKKRGKVRNAPRALISSNIAKHEQIKYTQAKAIDTSKMSPQAVATLILTDLNWLDKILKI